MHDFFKHVLIFCFILLYISSHESSGNFWYPTTRRSIFRCVIASFSRSIAVNSAAVRPYNTDGVTHEANNRNLNLMSTCLSASVFLNIRWSGRGINNKQFFFQVRRWLLHWENTEVRGNTIQYTRQHRRSSCCLARTRWCLRVTD